MKKSNLVVILFLIAHIGVIFYIYPLKIMSSIGYGHWLPVLITVSFQLVFLFVYLKGLSYFPNQDLISIFSLERKLLARVLMFPFMIYLFNSLLVVTRAYAEIITIIFLQNTPIWAIDLLIIFIAGYIAIKGFNTILYTALAVFFLFIPIIFFAVVTSFQNAQLLNIFPITPENLTFIYNDQFLISFFAVSPFLFLGFIPSRIDYEPKKIMTAAICLSPVYLLSVYVPILTFGPHTASTFLLPFSTTMDTISIRWLVFDRITIFYMLSIVTFSLIFGALLIWMLSMIIHRLYLPSIRKDWTGILIGALAFACGLILQGFDEIDTVYKFDLPLRVYSLACIPVILLIFGLKKGRKRHEQDSI